MTILKSQLIQRVNEVFKRNYALDTTELDDLITDCCWELSSRANFLHDENIASTLTGVDCYSLPKHFKDELIVGIDGEGLLAFEDFETYKMHTIRAPATGIPKRYSYERGFVESLQDNVTFLYLRPAPDKDSYIIRLYFACYHPRSIQIEEETIKACDHILFGDEFTIALQELLLWKWADSKNMTQEAMKHLTYAKDQIANLRDNIKNHWRFCQYYEFA